LQWLTEYYKFGAFTTAAIFSGIFPAAAKIQRIQIFGGG